MYPKLSFKMTSVSVFFKNWVLLTSKKVAKIDFFLQVFFSLKLYPNTPFKTYESTFL